METPKKFVMPKEFTIDHMFDKYLEVVRLDKRIMNPGHLREIRRAFTAGIGMYLLTLRDEIAVLPEDQAVQILDALNNEAQNFFLKESGQQN